MLKLTVKVNQPRVKADRTGTIGASTLIEMNESIYNWLSKQFFDGTEVILTMSTKADYPQLISTEAQALANQLDEE